jgi:hypothetical protein
MEKCDMCGNDFKGKSYPILKEKVIRFMTTIGKNNVV